MMVPYHPEMFREGTGELPSVGVGYKMLPKTLQFMYPEGVAGCTRWDMSAWVQWLTSSTHTIRLGKKTHNFMVELRSQKGVFVFATVVRLESSMSLPQSKLTHALELSWPRAMLVCRYKELKGLKCDPMLSSSWGDKVGYFPETITVGLYHHAMAMAQDRFTWEALLKRALVDGRVTYQGSAVKLQQALSDADARALVGVVYSRAFVDRYRMGKLGSEMLKRLKELVRFSEASFSAKVNIVYAAVCRSVWTSVRGVAVTDYLRDVFVTLIQSCSGRPQLGVVEFLPAPTFVTYESYAKGLSKYWSFMTRVRGAHVTVPCVRGDVDAWKAFGGPGQASVCTGFRHPEVRTVKRTGTIVEDLVDMHEPGIVTEEGRKVVDGLADVNAMGNSPFERFVVKTAVATPEVKQTLGPVRFFVDDAYVDTINEVHEAMFPGMAVQDFEQDARSLAIGGQERVMEAEHMRVPLYGTIDSGETSVYKSRLRTYPVEKRSQTAGELLSALSARTLATPIVATAQDDAVLIPKIWDNFLDMACVPDARGKVVAFGEDKVGLEKELLEEWTKKARPEALKKMYGSLSKDAKALEEMNVSEYLVMLKTDAKPPMSDKPLKEQVAPQVIVYHEKNLSALYSSIFRVLVRRFLSLLKPEWMVNLLKDGEGIRDHIAANHPWGALGLLFLENDFSKYDKSQHEFVFKLEKFVFERLGMRQDLLDKWMEGHERCSLRAVALGISLHVNWQRKSGDATTAFGNVILNVLSVCYAYAGSVVEWAVFMGDDSLVCCSVAAATPRSLELLSQIFNLNAKFLLSTFPYFASNFVLINSEEKQVRLVPDPIKRIQRWAVSMPSVDPRWADRFKSQSETCEVYSHGDALVGLEQSVAARYPVPVGLPLQPLWDAIATAVSSETRFRALYEENVTVVYRRH